MDRKSDRALQLVEPYRKLPWARGAFLVGSASRPFADETSDFDIEVVADDAAYAEMSNGERHVFAMDPERPKRVDYEFLVRPWSELDSLRTSNRDVDHYPFSHARILFDRDGDVAPLLADLGRLPDAVRDVRCRVHYLETYMGIRRAQKCLDRRGDELNLRLIAAGAVDGFVKLLFVLHGSWPALRHWASNELRLLGEGEKRIATLVAVLASPERGALDELLEETHRRLDDAGFDFHREVASFRVWAFLSDEGKRAFREWGAR